MSKLDAIKIKNFRGINELDLQNLSNMNIFIGENNAGKTSILEAIQLVSNPFSKINLVKIARQRELRLMGAYTLSLGDSIKWLFTKHGKGIEAINLNYSYAQQEEEIKIQYNEEKYFVIHSQNGEIEDFTPDTETNVTTAIEKRRSNEVIHSVKHEYNNMDTIKESLRDYIDYILFNCQYISSVDHKLNSIQVTNLSKSIIDGKKAEILEALKLFDKEITEIELVKIKDEDAIYVVHSKLGIVPLIVFGDGLRKALVIALKIIGARDGVVLIDEFETGIHTKLIPIFINWVATIAMKYNVQIFLTTHSLETVDGIINANIDDLNGLSFYRLSNKGHQIKAKYFDGLNMRNLRYDFGQDVR